MNIVSIDKILHFTKNAFINMGHLVREGFVDAC